MKGALPVVGGKETFLSPETGNSGPRRHINKLCYFFTDLRPRAQTSLSCQFITNVLFLGLKGVKAVCFGYFFESHISMSSCMYGIKIYVFFRWSLLCQFIWPAKEPRKEERKNFPPLWFSCPMWSTSPAEQGLFHGFGGWEIPGPGTRAGRR